tara:strand:- start:247 stop:1071 length:825 start_codon:yes stop_codon:yes gene_type:complete
MTQTVEFEGSVHEFPDDFSEDEISGMLAAGSNPNDLPEPDPLEPQGTSAMVDGIHQPELQTISAEEEAELFPDSDLRAQTEELTPMNAKLKGFRNNITAIETGSLDETFIRTQVNGSGSSAYGPVQITRGLISGYLKNKAQLFTEAEIGAMNELAERQRISLKIGGSDRPDYAQGGSDNAQARVWAKRYGYDDVEGFLNAFDYGGDFGLADDAEFAQSYEGFSRKMLQDHLKGAKGDEVLAAQRWHGGMDFATAKSKKGTAAYKKKYEALMSNE